MKASESLFGRLSLVEIARETGLPRSTITALYKETAERIELSAVESLCEYFECEVGEIFVRSEG